MSPLPSPSSSFRSLKPAELPFGWTGQPPFGRLTLRVFVLSLSSPSQVDGAPPSGPVAAGARAERRRLPGGDLHCLATVDLCRFFLGAPSEVRLWQGAHSEPKPTRRLRGGAGSAHRGFRGL